MSAKEQYDIGIGTILRSNREQLRVIGGDDVTCEQRTIYLHSCHAILDAGPYYRGVTFYLNGTSIMLKQEELEAVLKHLKEMPGEA